MLSSYLVGEKNPTALQSIWTDGDHPISSHFFLLKSSAFIQFNDYWIVKSVMQLAFHDGMISVRITFHSEAGTMSVLL